MKKSGKVLLILLFVILILVGISHIALHLSIFQIGIQKIDRYNIPNLVVGKAPFMESVGNYLSFPKANSYSVILIIAEWLLIIIIGMFMLLRRKRRKIETHIKKQPLGEMTKYKKSRTYTDIDALHDLLKEKKTLKISKIQRTFKISKETALDWCEILETGDLAEIHYPALREPIVTIYTTKKVNKDEKENK